VSNYGRSIVIAPSLWSYSDAIAARADDTLPPPNFVILVADDKYLSCRSISQLSQKSAHFQWKPPEKYRGFRGKLPFRLECRPAFDYARASHQLQLSDHGARFDGPRLSLGLAAPMPLQPDGHGVVADFTLGEGESATFVLRLLRPEDLPKPCPGIGEAEELFRGTVEYWRRWLAKCIYTGRWREMVHRSAMTLKLLSFEPTGAIVAAPTCSLPESIGGPRNWDYRYTWIRDAAFTLYGLLRIGFTEEAARFPDWLEARWTGTADCETGPLQLMYSIDGRSELSEEKLDRLEGYRASRPVRIGNAASQISGFDLPGPPPAWSASSRIRALTSFSPPPCPSTPFPEALTVLLPSTLHDTASP